METKQFIQYHLNISHVDTRDITYTYISHFLNIRLILLRAVYDAGSPYANCLQVFVDTTSQNCRGQKGSLEIIESDPPAEQAHYSSPVFFVLGSPELDTALQARPDQGSIEGEDRLL